MIMGSYDIRWLLSIIIYIILIVLVAKKVNNGNLNIRSVNIFLFMG